MHMRLISGKYGGRNIKAPSTFKTHPMSERARGAIYNRLHGAIEGADVLDAFAGSGALGFEALSRGAARAVFIEKDRVAMRTLRDNKALLGCGDEAVLVQSPVYSWVQRQGQLAGHSEQDELWETPLFDVIFADPPYNNEQFSTVALLFRLLKPGGLMVLSHSGKGEVPSLMGKVVVVDNRSYGNANITLYRKEA